MPRLGRLEKVALGLVALNGLLWVVGRPFPGSELLRLAGYVAALALLIRFLRLAARHVLWRVRNRMIVLFLFIGLVPLLLVTALVGLAGYVLIGQVAVHIATAELDRREARLQGLANALAFNLTAPEGRRPEGVDGFLKRAAANWPGLLVWARGSGRFDELEPPRSELRGARGLVRRQGRLYLVAYAAGPPGSPAGRIELAVLQPLTEAYLSNVEPGLGRLSVYSRARQVTLAAASRATLTEPAYSLDYEIVWGTAPFTIPGWTEADQTNEEVQLRIQTRPAAVYRRLFGQGVEVAQGVTGAFLILGTLFLVVELISLVTGISITRTVTESVHELYEGTQKVNQGIFSHRIPLMGHDQLAELARSFNSMTESIERLIEESKERERLASELAIAREVQAQLFPKTSPKLRTLEVLGVCHAARMVSGDYFDFVQLSDDRLALAIGDVAGKGISGALLMASIQSMLRTQLSSESGRSGREGETGVWRFPTASLVSQLNLQLYQNTTPEKYATFFFGAYDDRHGVLTYTNAGHLPPVLIRDGEARRLGVNGLVVGAFPFATYDQAEIELRPNDLLVGFTDGATEPENEFTEEFGEERLIELLVRHRSRPPREIIEEVIRAVSRWTGRPELQDDMTLLIARRL
jgi:sigma-B regulation protein RsbU (phosphoserine phosphatase)